MRVLLILVALSSLCAVACRSDNAGAATCRQATTRAECLSCCGEAGRSGATWVNEDCVCFAE